MPEKPRKLACVSCGLVDRRACRRCAQTMERKLADAEERVVELEGALWQHRCDLHRASHRPCPTCRQSAKALGIDGLVPYHCAFPKSDEDARKLLEVKDG